MPAFYLVKIKGDYAGTLVMNTFAYRSEQTDPPDQASVEAVADAVDSEIVAKLVPLQSDLLSWTAVEVQGYTGAWVRSPYLSHTKTIARSGTQTAQCAPGVLAGIISFRLTPREPQPVTLKPVRRGYIAVAGLPEGDLDSDGTISSGLRNSGPSLALLAELEDTLTITGVTGFTAAEAIRVSSPVGGADERRGYASIETARWSIPVSTRRSRKRGVGA